MPRYSDNTGIPQTCPLIDSVIHFLTHCEDSVPKDIYDTLEKIRQHNSDLRDFGNEQYKNAEEYEKEKDYYQNKVDDLEKDIQYLNSELKKAEKQLSEL